MLISKLTRVKRGPIGPLSYRVHDLVILIIIRGFTHSMQSCFTGSGIQRKSTTKLELSVNGYCDLNALHIYIYIFIYIERERKRGGGDINIYMPHCKYIYIYYTYNMYSNATISVIHIYLSMESPLQVWAYYRSIILVGGWPVYISRFVTLLCIASWRVEKSQIQL